MTVNVFPSDSPSKHFSISFIKIHFKPFSGQQLSQRKGVWFLLNKKEALSGLIQVNDDEERSGGQAGRVYGCQL